MTLDQRLTQAVHHVADRVTAPHVDLDAVRSRARTHRRRTVIAAVTATAAAVAVIVAGTTLATGPDTTAPDPVAPVRLLPGPVPVEAVWYDAAGLHHGRRVEQTPVDLTLTSPLPAEAPAGAVGSELGVLALVRTGAVYRDPATDDVWFHPWNGEPRVVGHGSAAGPGGDPRGDTAAWFEGTDLVVYDTARGREISRTTQHPVVGGEYQDHVQSGHGFKHVSAQEVVWRSERPYGVTSEYGEYGVHRFDVATERSSLLSEEPTDPEALVPLLDVHDSTRTWRGAVDRETDRSPLVIDVLGRPQRLFRSLDAPAWLSAEGSFVVSDWWTDDSHGVAIVDVGTGQTWKVAELVDERTGETWSLSAKKNYFTFAWSYGDLALVRVEPWRGRAEETLLACDAVTHVCDELPTQGDVLTPTS